MSGPWLDHGAAQVVVASILGLIAGSFLCLVAHRLPRMLRIVPVEVHGGGPFDLWRPPSHCPACGHRLSALENIPLLSWLLQRGRCRACGTSIGWREPAFEVAASILAVAALLHWGWGVEALCAAVFLWLLLLAGAVDAETGFLPDEATMPMLWAGLLASVFVGFADPRSAVLGAALGYVWFAVLRHLSLWLVGREGLGAGDAVLLAAIGSWTGWQSLPTVVLVAAALSLPPSLWARVRRPAGLGHDLPFGPGLAVAGALALFFPDVFGDPTIGALMRATGFV